MQVPTCWVSFYKRHSRQLENDMPTLEAIARQRRAAGSRGHIASARKHRGTKAFQERAQETVSGPRPRPASGTFTDWVESESDDDDDENCDDEGEDPDEQDHNRDRDRYGDSDKDDNENEAKAEDEEDDNLESEASFESDLTPAPPLVPPLAMTMTNGIGPDGQADIWQLSMIPAKA